MNSNISGKKFKKVPPEGGWGYVVLTGLVLCMVREKMSYSI